MAISSSPVSNSETPLLDDTVADSFVDYKGRSILRSKSGGWTSAGFIIGVEVAERFAFFGIASNLINFLTGPLGQSTATTAANVNAWSGTTLLLPLLGGFVADSYFGRYRTVVAASLLYILGLGLLTVTAVLASVNLTNNSIISTNNPPQFHVEFFFFSLYLAALGQGGHRPCVSAFGADQFDGHDPEESKAKSSFFNWCSFGLCAGGLATTSILSYIQDNLSWGLGFGVPCIAMVLAFIVFMLGTTTYRYTNIVRDKKSPLVRIGRVFIAAFRNWRNAPSAIATEEKSGGVLPQRSSEQFKFLNKALSVPNDLREDGKMYYCSIDEVEEAKSALRLIPIWLSCLPYTVIYAQPSTFFTKQGATMKRTIVPGFDVPPASLQALIYLSTILFLPIYGCILVPITRWFTGRPSGITTLQRIGIGMVLYVICMVISAFVEMKRLIIAQEHNLVDVPSATIPMSLWWLLPQYLVFGIANVFILVGVQEFFYDQVPNEVRSMGMALSLSTIGMGSFLSSFLISVIDEATGVAGKDSWFSSNLNRAHLDYFYWLLAVISAIGFVAYFCLARSYNYKV